MNRNIFLTDLSKLLTFMTEEEREAFLAPYLLEEKKMTSLCVMGGIFSEGIDLPGTALDGAIIVGTGLPQVNVFQKTLEKSYDKAFGDGFQYAYRIPGMQKVAQAAGRVIRTETDRGLVLLMDFRYFHREGLDLCPPHWQIRDGNPREMMTRFWQEREF